MTVPRLIKGYQLVLATLFCLFFTTYFSCSASAYDTRVVKKSEITRVASFPLSGTSLQGNTITRDYFVFSDYLHKGGARIATIRVVSRTDCNQVRDITNIPANGEEVHTGGLYNEWGSNYAYITNRSFDTDAGQDSCIDVAAGKVVDQSNCPSRPPYLKYPELNPVNYTQRAQGALQPEGSTFKHNGYLFRVLWITRNTTYQSRENKTIQVQKGNYVYVFKDGKTALKRYYIPNSLLEGCSARYESEDLSVDGDTGDVYVGFNCGQKGVGTGKATYYKIDSAVFGKYTKGTNNEARQVAVCDGFGQVSRRLTIGKKSGSSQQNSNSSSSSDNSQSVANKADTNNSKTPKQSQQTSQKQTQQQGATPQQNQTQQGTTPQQGQQGTNCVQTSIIGSGGEYCDDGQGSGVYAILNIVLTVLTFGVGIAATAGLIICGIKYATSGTNETQATNARRRIFEIVIGLIAYALMFLALQWLIPGFNQ